MLDHSIDLRFLWMLCDRSRLADPSGPARTLWLPGVDAAAVKQRGKERGVVRTKDTTSVTYETGPAAARMAQRLLGHLRHSRYLLYLAVLSTLLASALVMVYGTVQIAAFVVELVRHGGISNQWGAQLRLTVIEVVDLFLIGTVLFVIAVGLYQLFGTTMMPLPRWLLVHDVGDLERKLIGLVVTVLSVVFLGQIVTWDGQRHLLGFGIAIGAVIAGLTFFLRHEPRRLPSQDQEQEQPR
jgi:uncharacterized membrane protein YqhA